MQGISLSGFEPRSTSHSWEREVQVDLSSKLTPLLSSEEISHTLGKWNRCSVPALILGSCDDGRGCGRSFLLGRGCSWSSSAVRGSEFCGRDPHRVYRFLELSLALLPLPEAGIEHRLRGRYFLQISQRQRRAFIDSSGDLWQSRSYSGFILSDGLTGRKAQWVLPFLFSFSCRC